MLLPLAYLFVRSLEDGWAKVYEVLADVETFAVLGRSVLLAAVVTVACVAVAVPLAWLTARTDLPGMRAWAVLAALPLVVPSYVGGVVLVSALGPRGVLEEAARSLGSGAWSTFFRVTVPQLRPAIVAGSLLVALYALSDFGAVSLLQYGSFSREIYIQYQSAFDRTPAAILALMLVALTAAILLLEGPPRGGGRFSRGAAPRPATPVALGGWRWPALLFCGVVVTLALVAPVGVLSFWLVRGLVEGEPLRPLWNAAWSSVYASGLAAGVVAVAALPVAGLAVRVPGPISPFVEGMTYLGYALPGIVLALSLVFFGANYAPWAYQTLGMLVFAYAVHFLPQAVGATRAALLQVKPSVEEAARGLGQGPVRVVTTITAPLASSGILAGAALVFLTTMKELPATLLLAPLGFDTLATNIWSATSEGFFARAAAPALLLILVSALPMYLLVIRERVR